MARTGRQLADEFLDGDPLLTPAEVAALLRVDPKTVARWVLAGRFPDTPDGRDGTTRTVGGQHRIRESVVRGLIDGTLQPREARHGDPQ